MGEFAKHVRNLNYGCPPDMGDELTQLVRSFVQRDPRNRLAPIRALKKVPWIQKHYVELKRSNRPHPLAEYGSRFRQNAQNERSVVRPQIQDGVARTPETGNREVLGKNLKI